MLDHVNTSLMITRLVIVEKVTQINVNQLIFETTSENKPKITKFTRFLSNKNTPGGPGVM